ncbi:hypothetical protein PsAD2_01364 [Pseudovibrio axinellae]|uniref:Uncharacterized protein n=1 Tax=Pseudovibrio axinellae TaxID=989403 RepID=A0A166ACH6_9HYPH|nr:hypothetical protein [Pseudovibrio axinellae]KZL20869.1 hypothetical protein PsAD2_01364 [Pseudovibrio axinellae]SER20183.1 hypothetical protein SAMN05421798_10712 [Pseudovibrio axinellae]
MTRVMERHQSDRRLSNRKPNTLKSKVETAEARHEILDNIDELRAMNAQLSESLAKTIKTQSQDEEKLWKDVDGEKDDHHLGAGLNGRWF